VFCCVADFGRGGVFCCVADLNDNEPLLSDALLAYEIAKLVAIINAIEIIIARKRLILRVFEYINLLLNFNVIVFF